MNEVTPALSTLRERERQRALQMERLAEEHRRTPLQRNATMLLESNPACGNRRPREEVLPDLVGTYEVMELILSFTNHTTLLSVRGVSRQFRNLVDNSPLLQRRLFLLPDHNSRFRVLDCFPNGYGYASMSIEMDDNENVIVQYQTISLRLEAPFLCFQNRCGSERR